MTNYEYESYDWVIDRIYELKHELDMLEDIKEKLLDRTRLNRDIRDAHLKTV